ncbi:MAG: nucleotide exchange factor GrpE [Gammaproteobacteria bacterium]|nr:nucleotide exchange factor GrpE [Gammaproteobacteria bacterium]
MEKEQEPVEDLPAGEETPAEVETKSEAVQQPGHEELSLLLEDARNKADENWNKLVRSQAEVDNLRKRHQRELENAHKFSLERFVNALLPVLDSMELGIAAAGEKGADVEKLREGGTLTLKLLSGVMNKFEVVSVDPMGEPFNPDLHQAMSMQPKDDVPPNTVVMVVQKGYTLNGRLVRPAMVIVSQASPGKIDEKA